MRIVEAATPAGDCPAAMGAVVLVGGYATVLVTIVLVDGCSTALDAVAVVGRQRIYCDWRRLLIVTGHTCGGSVRRWYP